jgi:uncharacterized membrane protein YhaH (DUF805 family)
VLLVNWWKTVVLERYAQFSGRAGRAEFWWFFLANAIVGLVLNLLGQASWFFYVLSAIYSLALLIPNIAVGVRRLHDTNRSGWWLLIALVPLVGFIILIVFWATEGNAGENQYGPVPPGQPSVALA